MSYNSALFDNTLMHRRSQAPKIALQPMKNLLPKRLLVFSTRSKSGLWLDRRP